MRGGGNSNNSKRKKYEEEVNGTGSKIVKERSMVRESDIGGEWM